MSDAADPSKITKNLGKEWKITENSFKIHASCRHTHPAIDCILDIMNEQSISYQQINRMTIKTYQTVLNITDKPNPDSVYASKFSSQFCASLAAVHGSASLRDFTAESLVDSNIVNLMKKVDVIVNPYYENAYPEKWGAAVEIALENGKIFEKATDYPKGDPEKMGQQRGINSKVYFNDSR